jgi:hypothetical protein
MKSQSEISKSQSEISLSVAAYVIELLEDGKRTATYKLALLTALLDLAMQAPAVPPQSAVSIRTIDIAHCVIGGYWPHTLIYRKTGHILIQNSQKDEDSMLLGGSGIVRKVADFRLALRNELNGREPSFADAVASSSYRNLLRDIETILVKMPIPKLQVLPGGNVARLYVMGWQQNDSSIDLGKSVDLESGISQSLSLKQRLPDRFIQLLPGVLAAFQSLNVLLRSYIQNCWVDQVVSLNKATLQDSDVSSVGEFLFSRTRVSTQVLQQPLMTLQKSRCFYCGSQIRKEPEVDHFIPWSRIPDDGLHNLVAAHADCNRSKSNLLPSLEHLDAWLTRNADQEDEIRERIHEINVSWIFDPKRAANTAYNTYSQLPKDYNLWHGKESGSRFDPSDFERRILSRV